VKIAEEGRRVPWGKEASEAERKETRARIWRISGGPEEPQPPPSLQRESADKTRQSSPNRQGLIRLGKQDKIQLTRDAHLLGRRKQTKWRRREDGENRGSPGLAGSGWGSEMLQIKSGCKGKTQRNRMPRQRQQERVRFSLNLNIQGTQYQKQDQAQKISYGREWK
jgi:hypothetical protein